MSAFKSIVPINNHKHGFRALTILGYVDAEPHVELTTDTDTITLDGVDEINDVIASLEAARKTIERISYLPKYVTSNSTTF